MLRNFKGSITDFTKYYNNIKSVVTKINIVDKNKFVGVLQKII